jgi:FdhD protein
MSAPTIVREPGRAPATPVDVVRARGGGSTSTTDAVAVEEPLEIRLNGWRWLVTMRTPGDDADLIVGLLAAEGAITRADEIERILFTRHPDEPDLANVADVHVRRPLDELQRRLGRNHPLASASCGLCGASTIEAIRKHTPAVPPGPAVTAHALATLPEALVGTQAVFRATGGLHAAALFDRDGALLAAREDIGRHSATDKVLGWQLRTAAAAPILLVSGRASFEIVQKALVARVPILAAVSAPSSLAVALARAGGMTLVGFLRGRTMNVYTAPERVTELAGLAAAAGEPTSDSALAAAAVELIPRAMRTLLDAVQLKISLADWQALSVGERTRLLALTAEQDAETFAAYLHARTVARTGRAPRPLAPGTRKPAGA